MKIRYFFLITMLSSLFVFAKNDNNREFKSKISPIPKKIKAQMHQYTWRHGCPLAIDHLAYVQLSYWGFDNNKHTGVLIVNKELAQEV